MSAYFQMGHDSENLIGGTDLDEFRGAILSPVNRDPGELRSFIPKARGAGIDDVILDPQFYFPRSARGQLATHSYFPSDFDTADYTSDGWWADTVDKLATEGIGLEVDAIASPVVYPKVWDEKFWSRSLTTISQLKRRLSGTPIRSLFTVFVDLNSIQSDAETLRVGSIISESAAAHYLLILVTSVEPRREIADAAGLCGFMQLINLLSENAAVTVAYTCSDVLLYKVAGAANCATGKFFNLRRFTTSRFDESEKGGGQIPYWFEPGLLAFLREADVLRLKRRKLNEVFENGRFGNIWTAQIEESLAKSPPDSWLAKSWRQYLSSFGKMEKSFTGVVDIGRAADWLKTVEARWRQLEDQTVLMDEARNDGRWIRPWRQAIEEFRVRCTTS